MTEERKPCIATSMNCVALAEPEKTHCVVHEKKPKLKPEERTDEDEYFEGYRDGHQAAIDEADERAQQEQRV